MNYYNEYDKGAAQWLRELISAGEIPAGHVDERSIVDVRPSDLAGYVQCHFFAGIGGWSYALKLAGWPDGRRTGPSGPEAAPANPSVPLASSSEPPTPATSGPPSSISSRSAALTLCLANRLKARLGKGGSMEYAETWKEKATPAGLRYWAHTASGHRTSGNDSTGWPTPTASDEKWRYSNEQMALKRLASGKQMGLEATAYLSGWGTPNCMDHLPSGNLESRRKKGGCCNLKDQVTYVSGRATPTSRDHKDGTSEGTAPTNGLLGRQVWSSPVQTGKRGALNPAFSRWLMGYPDAWDSCGATAMQSSRKSRPSSSALISIPSEDLL